MKINFFDIRAEQFSIIASKKTPNNIWNWGENNMLPYAFEMALRKSPIHRSIINKKVNYTAGSILTSEDQYVKDLILEANNKGDSLREILKGSSSIN